MSRIARRAFSTTARPRVRDPGISNPAAMRNPPPPATQIAKSSNTPCGATKATSRRAIPLLAYSPTTLPSEIPLNTSTNTLKRPAVTPPAKTANVTCTLFVTMLLAITGRSSCGSSM